MTREAMKQALEALLATEFHLCEIGQRGSGYHRQVSEAITALRRALEPVTCGYDETTGNCTQVNCCSAQQPAAPERFAALIEAINHERQQTEKYFRLYEDVCETAVFRLREIARLDSRLAAEQNEFQNFHRALCERFGYTHDKIDWKRDQVSLIEWIAKLIAQPAAQWVGLTDEERGVVIARGMAKGLTGVLDLHEAKLREKNGGGR